MNFEGFHEFVNKQARFFSILGDGLGFASTMVKKEHAENMTIASGALNSFSGVTGAMDDIGCIGQNTGAEITLDLYGHLLDSTAAILDILTGEKGLEVLNEKGSIRSKAITQILSGGVGGLNGLLPALRGVIGLLEHRQNGKDAEMREERRKAMYSLIKGLGNILNEVAIIGQGLSMIRNGQTSSQFWDIFRVVSSAVQLLTNRSDIVELCQKEIDLSSSDNLILERAAVTLGELT